METLNYILLLGLALIVFRLRTFFNQPKHRLLSHIAKLRGPIVLLNFRWRPVLLISSASAAEDLFTKHDLVFANRPKLVFGKVFGRGYKNLAWAPHGELWQHLRRTTCNDIVPCHGLPDQHRALAHEMKQLLLQLHCNHNGSVKLRPLFTELVFNVMMRIFAGERYSEMKEEGKANELLECASDSFKITTGETDVVYFMPILKWLGLTGLEQKCSQLQEKCESLVNNLINKIQQRSSESSVDGIIQCLLNRQKKDPENYTDEKIIGLMLVLLSAGTDTTAGTLEWALALLLNHPEVLKKAQNEIDNYVGNKRLLEQSDIDQQHLPYLHCIVKETMRLYPAAPLLVPHLSSDDCQVGKYYVPKDTTLIVNAWAIQRDPSIWKEPTKFNPERFMDIVDEKDIRFKLMPFGYGRRSCPGQHMAFSVITMALGSLIHCFNWERVSEKNVDMTEQKGIALFMDKPLMAVCRPRLMMDNLISNFDKQSLREEMVMDKPLMSVCRPRLMMDNLLSDFNKQSLGEEMVM